MAKVKLSRLLPGLESEDGVAQPVDASAPSAEVGKDLIQQIADDGSGKGDVAEAAFEVEVDGKDFTAIDEASKRQGQVIHDRLERLDEAQASVESYLGILQASLKSRQSVCSGTAAVIRHDLQAQYPKFFSKVVPSLEAFDGDQGLTVSNELMENLKQSAGKLGAAAKEAWKKFWEWVKSIYVKVKALIKKVFGIVETETKKTAYLLDVAKAIPEKGKSPKSLPKPPVGVTSKAAAKVQLLIGHEKKVVPSKELPKTISIPGASILESVENDLWGMTSRETGGLTHIYDYYTNMMWRAANHLKKEVITEADAALFEKDIQDLAKFPTTAIFAGNKKFEYKEGTASLKLVSAGSGGKSFEEVKMLSKADIENYLEQNAILLGNIKWIGESWEKTLTMLSELDTKVKSVENAEVKSIVTKRITEFLNSDVDAFFKLCTEVAAKRNQLLDHMLMIHVDCAGSGSEK
jgi:hypothetical protein